MRRSARSSGRSKRPTAAEVGAVAALRRASLGPSEVAEVAAPLRAGLVEPDAMSARRALERYCEGLYELPLDTVRALQLMIAGSPSTCENGIEEFVEAGARHIVLRIAALGPGEQLGRLADALGVRRPDDSLASNRIADGITR